MNSYQEVFASIQIEGRPLFTLLGEEEGQLHLAFSFPKGEQLHKGEIRLPVPIVKAVRYPWDQGLFGHTIQMPRGALGRLGIERFCHPLLHSHKAEEIAAARDRVEFSLTREYRFGWMNFYCRLQMALLPPVQSLLMGQRRPEPQVVWSRLHRAMREMVNRLPTTDEAKIVRQMFEVGAGYPDVVGDNWLWERIKERYLRKLDSFCDVLATGKSDVGRHVMRVRPDAPKSHVTGQPLPDFTLAVAPLSPWSNPTRVERENRAICEAHTFVDPEPYPLFVKGLRMPTALKSRVQTVMVAIMDVPGHNVFIADAETAEEFGVEIGDEICLDALLVTPTGRARLTVMQRENLLLPAEKYLPRREEFMQYPGFQEEEIPDLVETMLDGTAVFAMQYRVSWDVPVRCRYDKVKWLQGGIKAVCRPVCQFFTEIGGEKVPIDVIVSEKALLSKGGVRDGVASALAALAGMTEIDPALSFEELCQQIEAQLAAKGLPRDGRLPIFLRHSVPQRREPTVDAEHLGFYQREYEEIGAAVCGPIAVIRTQETERRQSSVKTGMRVNIQARCLSGARFPHDAKIGALVESYARAYQNASEAAASEAVTMVG